ncbi:hypothetical protein, partial [Streptomyces smyrnaeus]|uniref:hypothetical protein n=1 Tax=Streptomyces smyrnaeus TaxID=1387713 RepID=UPI0036A70D17
MGKDGAQAARQVAAGGEFAQPVPGVFEGSDAFGPSGLGVPAQGSVSVHQSAHRRDSLVTAGSG